MQRLVGHVRHCLPYPKNNEESVMTFIREVLVLNTVYSGSSMENEAEWDARRT